MHFSRGGGGHSPMKMTGVLVENFQKTPLKGTRISFCGRGFDFIYTPKRYQFWNIKLVANDMTIFKLLLFYQIDDLKDP